MYNITVTEDSVDYAQAKLKTWASINQTQDGDDKLDALHLYCESLGMNAETINYLLEACVRKYGVGSNHVFVGTLIGLALAEHALEHNID